MILLSLARAKAIAQGLAQAEFRQGDLLALDLPAAQFDAVVCVFGIFFIPDMPAAVRALWRLVRSGGQLAVTTWGPDLFEPLNTAFWEAVRAVRPELYKSFNPWDLICTPVQLRGLLEAVGVAEAGIVAEAGTHPLATPEAAWALIMGSGYRGTFEKLEAAEREQVRAAVWGAGAELVTTNVVYAVAVKP